MNKVIILSCNTGQGHNSCAEAIRETFEDRGVRCDIRDGLAFVSPGVSRFVSWGHSFMYRYLPSFFRWGYRVNEEHPGFLKEGSPMIWLLKKGTGRLREAIETGGYDTVICTHMFSALMLSELLKKTPLPVQTAFVATDYTCCPGTEFCLVDKHFLPCGSLDGVYRDNEHFRERAVVTGIPVRKEFWTSIEKEEAKARLHISLQHKHLLLMCGSMGCGPIVNLLQELTRQLPPDLEVSVICGTNERLQEKLAQQYKENERVHIVGYADDISLYMDAADLYLTKPGGIGVTEAAAKTLPMVFVDAVSGCEKYNMDYFTGIGAAITDPSIPRLTAKCLRLLASDAELEKMRQALRSYDQPNGAKRIYEELSQ